MNRQSSSDEVRRKAVNVEVFEPLLNLPEAATLLRIHPKTLEKWARTGSVPAFSVGSWRFRASDLDQWLKRSVSSGLASQLRVGR